MIEPGDIVDVWIDGWRTGVFLGIVEHTKSSNGNFGMYRVKPNFLDVKEVLVRPGEVKFLREPEVSDLLE